MTHRLWYDYYKKVFLFSIFGYSCRPCLYYMLRVADCVPAGSGASGGASADCKLGLVRVFFQSEAVLLSLRWCLSSIAASFLWHWLVQIIISAVYHTVVGRLVYRGACFHLSMLWYCPVAHGKWRHAEVCLSLTALCLSMKTPDWACLLACVHSSIIPERGLDTWACVLAFPGIPLRY